MKELRQSLLRLQPWCVAPLAAILVFFGIGDAVHHLNSQMLWDGYPPPGLLRFYDLLPRSIGTLWICALVFHALLLLGRPRFWVMSAGAPLLYLVAHDITYFYLARTFQPNYHGNLDMPWLLMFIFLCCAMLLSLCFRGVGSIVRRYRDVRREIMAQG